MGKERDKRSSSAGELNVRGERGEGGKREGVIRTPFCFLQVYSGGKWGKEGKRIKGSPREKCRQFRRTGEGRFSYHPFGSRILVDQKGCHGEGGGTQKEEKQEGGCNFLGGSGGGGSRKE